MKTGSKNSSSVTKADLSKLVTKSDLKKFATKTELRSVEKSLRREILRVEEGVESLEERMGQRFDRVMTHLDGIAKGVEDLRIEDVVGTSQIEDLRKRVLKLESS